LKIAEKNTKIQIEDIFLKLKEANYSIGVFKMPKSNRILLLGDEFPSIIKQKEIDLEQLKGFIISPFQENDNTPIFLIKPSFTASFTLLGSGEIVSENEPYEDFIQTSVYFQKVKTSKRIHSLNSTDDENNFENNVKIAVEAIETGNLKKVVLARQQQLALKDDFNVVNFFVKLCTDYPNSFVSLVDSPISGIWIGASPELLVSIDDKDIFRTVALAGTKPVIESNLTSKASWTEKEIEEQALVCRYIIECFKKIRLREYEEIGPKTVQAGNLLHLKTEFSVNMKEVNYENLGTILLGLLHPTSAICGTPKAEALQLIEKLEKSSREYYSGFLGPINLALEADSNAEFTSLFVNLRCMKVEQNMATLFAGAGITQDSVPESEYLETENKFLTLASKL